jgi:hypothetical protein
MFMRLNLQRHKSSSVEVSYSINTITNSQIYYILNQSQQGAYIHSTTQTILMLKLQLFMKLNLITQGQILLGRAVAIFQ